MRKLRLREVKRVKIIESVTGQELESGLLISRLVHISGLLEPVPMSRV